MPGCIQKDPLVVQKGSSNSGLLMCRVGVQRGLIKPRLYGSQASKAWKAARHLLPSLPLIHTPSSVSLFSLCPDSAILLLYSALSKPPVCSLTCLSMTHQGYPKWEPWVLSPHYPPTRSCVFTYVCVHVPHSNSEGENLIGLALGRVSTPAPISCCHRKEGSKVR